MFTPEQLSALRAEAQSWVGTPFCANSRAKGAGVSCHHLAAEIYFGAHWLPRFDLPAGAPHHGRAGSTPVMENFLDASPHFQDADPSRALAFDPLLALQILIEPGFLVLSRPARLPYHLAIALDRGEWIHVQAGGTVQIAPEVPPAWGKRAARIYRPLLSHHE